MNTRKVLFTIAVVFTLSLIFTACGGEGQLSEEDELATVVASTMATLAVEAESADAAPEEGQATTGDMQPLDAAECEALASEMGQSLGVTISNESVAIEMSWSGETGSACQLTGLGDGNNFEGIFNASGALKGMLESRGWAQYMGGLPCLGHGGWGPAADQACYVMENKTCEIMITVDPIDMSLCDDVEGPIGECLASLAPEQIVYSSLLTCAEGKLSMPPPKSGVERIEFASGATSAEVQDQLVSGYPHQYVLSAMQGQEMTVNLNTSGAVEFDVLGQDGSLLNPDQVGSSSWTGLLPSSQDYYIEVFAVDTGIMDYSLEVIIPAAESSGQVYPRVEPFPFGHMQAFFIDGVPPMLPPEFPIEEGQPAIVPYGLSGGPGEYEFSLDFGNDCQGAGACHYGVVAGMETSAPIPVGSSSFAFDAENAEQVDLANNISGYFVDYSCGANCSDAMVWWIYEGYQYMLGLKAGERDGVIALANAAINNSIP